MLWKQYEGKGNLIVHLWTNGERERDIIGGDPYCKHDFINPKCICGAWNGYWGEEADAITYYEHSVGFAVLNHHFENIIVISRKIIPVEFSLKQWRMILPLKFRSVIYSTFNKKFLNVFSSTNKDLNGFKVIDFDYMLYLKRNLKNITFLNPTIEDVCYTGFNYAEVTNCVKKKRF